MKPATVSCLLVLLSALVTPRAEGVTIQDVRIAFEPQKDRVRVRQMIALMPEDSDSGPYGIPLPVGARETTIGHQDGLPEIALLGKTVSVPTPLPEEGRVVQLIYHLPILDGIVALARELEHLNGVELLAYYDLWRAKLKRFGLTSKLPESVKPPSRSTVDSWNRYLRDRGVQVIS